MALRLGYRPGRLELDITPGVPLVAQVELQQPVGTPFPWPAGTAAWLRVHKPGTAFDVDWPATVSGAVMSWNVTAASVTAVPRGAVAELWIDFPTADPFVWLTGSIGETCSGASSFGVPFAVLVMPDDSQAVAVPMPGLPGPPGSGGVAEYVWTQATPASQWGPIPHGLSKPIVGALVYSLDLGTEYSNVFVEQVDVNTCRLWVSPPIAGIARIY